MKIITLISLILSSTCLAQFKLNYNEIQNKYDPKNVEKKVEMIEQTKILKDSIIANFFFTKTDSILTHVAFEKKKGFTKKEFDDLVNEYFEGFNPTKIKDARNMGYYLYYDDKKNRLAMKVYEDSGSEKVIQVLFTIDRKTIDGFLPLMEAGH